MGFIKDAIEFAALGLTLHNAYEGDHTAIRSLADYLAANGDEDGAYRWRRILNGDSGAMFELGLEMKRAGRWDNARYWLAQADAAGHLLARREFEQL
jgi:hypothetical protein